jgi:outer membrane receptor protein involved in Fe transport
MFRLSVLLSFLLIGFSASAGTISGTVRDAKDSSTMVGVVVSIAGTAQGTQTDMDGHYEFKDLANGSYTLDFNYVTYTKQSQTVTVADGATTLDIFLKAPGNNLKGATVSTTRRTNTETSVVLEMKKSNVVVSGISAAQISKTMDRNAADVVKRIPGVTIQDDRFITVRGLADRYNTVWLNDAGAPSSETDKKAFSFDIIPSGLIDRILVFKTPSAELPGDFAGGMVKVYTTSIPDKNTYTFGVSTSYRAGSTGTNFNYNQKSSTDWLGYDKNVRSLPTAVPAEFITANQSNDPSIAKSFGNDYKILEKVQPLDLRLNGSASNVFKLGRVKLGSTVGFSYANTSTNYNVTRQDFDNTDKKFNTNNLTSSNKVNVSGLANVAAVIGNSKIEFKNLYNQLGNSFVTVRTDNPDSFAQRVIEPGYVMGYESRATYSTQLTGSHHNDDDTRKYTWALGYADIYKNQPDLRRLKYVFTDTSGTGEGYARAAISNQGDVNNGGRYYASLFENTYSFSHQFSQKFKVGSIEPEVSLGNYIEYKSRKFEARELAYSLSGSSPNWDAYTRMPINEIFADENVGGDGQFKIKEQTNYFDKYQATNRLIASFVSLNLPITARLKAVAGVRYEDNLYTLKAMLDQTELAPEVSTKFFLPSINVSYNFSTKSLIRAAYGKTLNRPEFRENSPFYFYDFERRSGGYGAMFGSSLNGGKGDTLDVATIQNVDVRYEYYPSAGELVHIGGFYKSFKNPIQQVGYYTGSGRDFTVINANSAYCYGIELDVRKSLAFLDDKLNARNIFKNLTMVANVSLSKSELTIDTARFSQSRLLPKNSLEGQSNYVINTGLFYQSDSLGLQGSLLYNVYGPRMYSLGTTTDATIGELAFHSLDLTVTKTIYKHYQFSLGVQNLLDQSYRFVLDGNRDDKFKSDDQLYTKYAPGRYFTAGIRVRF